MRFNANPAQNPLIGTEAIPATDISSGNDCKITPVVLTEFARSTMALASGSNNGLMSGSQAARLNGLYSNEAINAFLAQVGQVSVPLFFPDVADGTIEVFENVLDNDVVFSRMGFGLSSGSTIMTARIDAVPVTGWTNLAVTSGDGTATATAARTIAPGSILSLQFSSSGTPENLRLTLRGDMDLV